MVGRVPALGGGAGEVAHSGIPRFAQVDREMHNGAVDKQKGGQRKRRRRKEVRAAQQDDGRHGEQAEERYSCEAETVEGFALFGGEEDHDDCGRYEEYRKVHHEAKGCG